MKASDPIIANHWVSEKLLEISQKNLETTKKDLEKNWIAQIVGVSASFALIFGLGEPLSHKIFDEPGYDRVLYLVLPLVNFYLFMRFGGLLSAFSAARFAAEQTMTAYYRQAKSRKLKLDAMPPPQIYYQTNSYFEYFHNRETNFGAFAYLLFVPIVLALNNSISSYLLLEFFGKNLISFSVALAYFVPIIILYLNYYKSNKDRPFAYMDEKFNFILFSYIVIFGICLILLFVAVWHPITLKLGPTASPMD
jgi:hypothetical protein